MTGTPRETAGLVSRSLTGVVGDAAIDAIDGILGATVVDHGLVFRTGHGPETENALGWRVLSTIHSRPVRPGLTRELGVVPELSTNYPLTNSTDHPDK